MRTSQRTGVIGVLAILGLLIGMAAYNSIHNGPSPAKAEGLAPIGEEPSHVALARELSKEARERQDREWGDFRTAFPYHMQVVAVSEPYDDGTRTLIVSEPPPHVTLEKLKEVDPAALATAEVKTHTIGHDGWVKDVVFHLSADQQALTRLVASLSRCLYDTDYKSYCLHLPINVDSLRTKYPLDLRVGPAELNTWMNGAFVPLHGGEAVALKDMTDGKGGVFVSSTPGLIAWVIPFGARLEDCRADARRFALDSDLILGGIKTANKAVVVIGRERVAPVDVMPPLRAETIVLLASAKTDSLSQSYERNAFFAGKFRGPWDWAPAYLSPALIDTEYGSLLNIADQLLKSWTQHGEVRYQNFPYPDPPRYPFDKALLRVLKASSLLFNWNTTGVGFVVTMDDRQVYGLNRTGALSVIYRPDEKEGDDGSIHGDIERVKKAEEDGYNYFATLNDPLLARVVQYTALYQLFFQLEVTATKPKSAPAVDTRPLIVKRLGSAVQALMEADDAAIEKKAKERASKLESVLHTPGGGTTLTEQQIRFARVRYEIQCKSDMRRLRETLKNYKSTWGERGLNTALDAAVRSRDNPDQKLDRLVTQAEFDALIKLIKELFSSRRDVDCWAGVATVQREFSSIQGDGSQPWLHTQTIVVSRGTGSTLGATGGHNNGSKVTKFEPNDKVLRGEVKKSADGTLQYNPGDVKQLRELVRLAARENTNPMLTDLLKQQLARAPRRTIDESNPAKVLCGERAPGSARGFEPAGHVPPAWGSGPPRKPPGGPPDGMPPPHSPPPEKPPLPPRGNGSVNPEGSSGFLDAVAGGIYMEKKGGKVYLHRNGEQAEVWNSRDAVFAVCNELKCGGRDVDGRPLKVMFGEGYDANDAHAFLKTVRESARRYPEARPVVVYRPLTKAGMARFTSRVIKAQPATFEVTVRGQEIQILGTLSVTDAASTTFDVKVDMNMRGTGESITKDRVNATVTQTTGRVTKNPNATVTDLGVEIYTDLRKLEPSHRPTNAVIYVADAGDFHIVRDATAPPGEQRAASPTRIQTTKSTGSVGKSTSRVGLGTTHAVDSNPLG